MRPPITESEAGPQQHDPGDNVSELSHPHLKTTRADCNTRFPREKFRQSGCLSSIILSPLNGNVKMSPYETGDIHVESEGTAKSERHQRMHQRRYGVCHNPRTP